MALTSQLFNGDSKLEAAALSDPAHITQGHRGDHVAKIQQALNQLSGARLTADGVYGQATAAAVLSYKQRRGIVNRSYQASADNIVGKMTVLTLDREMATLEIRPSGLRALDPPPLSTRPSVSGPILAFAFSDAGIVGAPGAGTPARLTDLVAAPVNAQVVIPPNRIGLVQPTNFVGGVLILSQPPNPNTTAPRIAKLISGTNLRTEPKLDNADVVANPETFRYQTFFECGTFKMQAVGPGTRKSAIAEFFVLVDTSSYADEPVHPVDPAFKSGLVSTRGTPLNPLAGRKINLFGRGETNGFENYSTSLPFCNDSGPNTKPWTDDPRKPGVGIEAKSVMNISIRSSPIQQVTLDEIKRIAAPGCRVTFSGPAGEERFMNVMKKTFLESGLAKSPAVEDGTGAFGRVLVFEFK
ncbi:MAG: peptidoglycan-binding protein [Rhizobacter sp.]